MVFEFVHKQLPWQVESLSGYYQLEKEKTLEFRQGLILYHLGFGVVDNSCCGVGGCSYALVQGLILELKFKKNHQGWFVSRLKRIEDQEKRERITGLIVHREKVQQVLFNDWL